MASIPSVIIIRTFATVLLVFLLRNDCVDATMGKPAGGWRHYHVSDPFLSKSPPKKHRGGRGRLDIPFLPPQRRPNSVLPKLVQSAWNKTRTAGLDLFTGAMEVHNNFLEMKGALIWNEFRFLVPTISFFSFLNLHLGAEWTKNYRVGLMKVLNYSRWVCRLPRRMVLGLPLFLSGRLLLPFHVFLLKPPPTSGRASSIFLLNDRFQKLLFLFFPAGDEVAFRWLTYRFWKRVSSKSRKSRMDINNNNNNTDTTIATSDVQSGHDDTDDSSEMEIKDQRKWVLLTSLIYGVAQADVSLFQFSDEQLEEMLAEAFDTVVPVGGGGGGGGGDVAVSRGVEVGVAVGRFIIYHSALLKFVSEIVSGYTVASMLLAPTFLSRGLMASIGARMFWKTPFDRLQIPIRLLFRFFRKVFGN